MPLLKTSDDLRVYGPYLSKSRPGQPRRFVVLLWADGRRKTTSYARWLMEEQLGRPLRDDEEADHRDDDRMNDVPANLQILTPAENRRKSAVVETATFVCPACGNTATKPAAKVRHNRKQGKAGPFCDKKCARAWQLREPGEIR